MVALILIESLAVPAERGRGRHNPRVVKRKMSGFKTKARAAPASSRVFRYEDHIRVVAPAVPPERRAPPPAARSEGRSKRSRATGIAAPTGRRAAPWSEHVRAWRASGLSRRTYCERHRLAPSTFHRWVARARPTFRREARPHPDEA
jgi:hypothetical protein